MLLDNEIEDFLDDGFEGSQVERSIFREIFFRNDIGNSRKKCLVTGVINFECESSKNTSTSLGSNSENSVQTSYSSSRNTCLEDFSNVTEEFKETSELVNFPKKISSEKRNGEVVSELPNAEADLGKGSSAFGEKNASTGFSPAIDPVSEVVTLRLVECSSQGLTSSCYLLKQHGGLVRGCRIFDPNTSKCKAHSLEGNDPKEAAIGKPIASPASQESFASRLLAASPSVNVQERYESPLHAEERPQEPQSFELDLSDVALKKNLKKDPRQLLQYHVVDLLRAAGWHIERRKRPSRQYMESVYRTPKGRSIREFAKAWRVCGELLSADRRNLAEQDAGKEWANIGQFLSDLSDTLVTLEKEAYKSELSCRWRLLDPFVIVAFVNRKIGALRKGEVVKATQSKVADRNKKSDVPLPLTNTGNIGNYIGNQIAEGDLPTSLCESVLADENALVVSEGDFHDCYQQYGNVGYGGLKNKAVEFLKGMPLNTAKGEGMLMVNASNKIGGLLSEVSVGKTSSVNITSFAEQGTGSTVVQSAQISDKQSSDCNVETAKEVNSFDSNDESLRDQVSAIGHYLLRSRDDYPNGKGNELVLFNELETGRNSAHANEDDRQQYETSELTVVNTSSPGDIILKKKTRRKSKRISEMEPGSLNQCGNQVSTSVNEADLLFVNSNDIHLESNQVQGDLIANERIKGIRNKSTYLKSTPHQIEKKGLQLKRNCSYHTDSKIVKKKSARCRIEDDDLLVSAIIKNKDFSPSNARNTSRKKASKSRARRKLKSQKRTCRLLPSLVNAGKHFKDGKWYSVGVRTVLSLLIGSGVISLNDVIQYRNPKGDVIKDGVITRDGILCKCCSKLLTLSAFKIHSGFKLNRPCLNLFMESGEPFTLCLLEAWSAEYKTRKGGNPTVQIDENDQNDDSCGLCGDGGELLCCDNCPSTFHPACLSAQDLPEGSWYCPNCTCWICGSLVIDKEGSSASDGLKCSQCEHKYHEACLKEKGRYQGAISDSLFCGRSCQEVYSGLQSRVGVVNYIADDFSWALLKCIHDDQKVHSAQRFALKAECNSRLAVALTIMEECFLSMVDPRTGIDMIPHVLYNWGSDFARLNFQGFYTVVLEKDDVLIAVACIRVHGTAVAEMPLIATCSKYRRQGMCRRLVSAIEEMLISFKVEKIVVAAIPDLVKTWTEGFGFTPVEDSEKQSLNKINLMVFPGTVLLKKPMFDDRKIQGQSGHTSEMRADESTQVDNSFSTAEPVDKFKKQFNENDIVECNKFIEFEHSTKIKVIDGDIGVDGMSTIGIAESTEVRFNSREVVQSMTCHATEFCTDAVTEPIDAKIFPRSEVCARTDAGQQSNVHCHPIRLGAETESIVVQRKDFVGLGVIGGEMKSSSSINPSDGIYCQLDVSTKSEIGLEGRHHMRESEFGAKLKVVTPVQHQSNGNCYDNGQEFGLDEREAERISLQDQFSKLSCEDSMPKLGNSQPERVSGVEALSLYDETQVCLDGQLKKACEVNVR